MLSAPDFMRRFGYRARREDSDGRIPERSVSSTSAHDVRGGVRGAYDDAYAAVYERYYVAPWPEKHEVNRRILERLLERQTASGGIWLDSCCGQAWHFWKLGQPLQRLGIDRSVAQLRRARARTPEAWFLCGDIEAVPLQAASCALVTNFWAGYCYLSDPTAIYRSFRRSCRAVRPGGDLYFEILCPEDVATFNASTFAAELGFRVVPVTSDCVHWEYRDVGGIHRMCSPPLSMFLEVANKFFQSVHHFHDGSFMTHLVGVDRRPAVRKSDVND